MTTVPAEVNVAPKSRLDLSRSYFLVFQTQTLHHHLSYSFPLSLSLTFRQASLFFWAFLWSASRVAFLPGRTFLEMFDGMELSGSFTGVLPYLMFLHDVFLSILNPGALRFGLQAIGYRISTATSR